MLNLKKLLTKILVKQSVSHGFARLSIGNYTYTNTSSALITSSDVQIYTGNSTLFEKTGNYYITVKKTGWYNISTWAAWSAVPNTTNIKAFAGCWGLTAGNYYDGYAITRGNTWEDAGSSIAVSITAGTTIALSCRSEGGSATLRYGYFTISPLWITDGSE